MQKLNLVETYKGDCDLQEFRRGPVEQETAPFSGVVFLAALFLWAVIIAGIWAVLSLIGVL